MRTWTKLFVVVATATLMMAMGPVFASTFTVNSTSDGGDQDLNNGVCNTTPLQPDIEPECTLRAAIEQANANNNPTEVDRIEFSIGANGVATIFPGSPLPTITQPVDINDYSAPDASANTMQVGDNADLRIRIDGLNAPGISNGLAISGANNVVRGLSITRFGGAGIDAFGLAADNNTITGNFVGITPGGKDRGNGKGVVVSRGASDNTVGGTTRQARNIISGNGPSPNFTSSGVDIFSMSMPTTGNKVQGNYIGTDKSGTGDLGNTGRGVVVYDGAGNTTIGDDDLANGSGGANVIAFNGFEEVAILDGTANSILSNSIFSNDRLGIDLGGNGVTPKDGAGDADPGPNNLQFFKNPEGNKDEGKTFIGQKSVSTDAGGIKTFTFRPDQKVRAGNFITATATHDGDTSEFSAPRLVRSN